MGLFSGKYHRQPVFMTLRFSWSSASQIIFYVTCWTTEYGLYLVVVEFITMHLNNLLILIVANFMFEFRL